MPIRMPLKFGMVAEVVTDETDRPAYVPPVLRRDEHHPDCRCGCRTRRDVARQPVKAEGR